MENKKNYGWKGFLPLLTFLAIYLGAGLIFTAMGYGGDSFKQVPRMAALVGSLLVCMAMGGKGRNLEFRMDTFCKGMSNQGTMIMVFLLAGVIGFATGSFDVPTFAQAMGSGTSGMYDICLIALLLHGVGGVAEELGAINWLVAKMHSSVNSRKGAEYMAAGMVSVFDAAIANNTIAIMMAAPLVRKVVSEHNVAPKRVASILDIFSCVIQGLIPHGGQVLLCISLTGLSPFAVIGANFYCFPLAIVALCTIQFGLGRTKEEKEGIKMYDEDDEVIALK